MQKDQAGREQGKNVVRRETAESRGLSGVVLGPVRHRKQTSVAGPVR